MTDEEMAEEWLDERYLKNMGVRKPCKQAFLAGLKAGRPKWRKVADGDLPKRNNELTDRSDVVITDKGIAHYNFRKQKWYVHNFEWGMSFPETIIAWCEIPQYEEE